MRIQYVLTEAFKNISRNMLVVVGAVLAVFFSLGIILATLVVGEVVRVNTSLWAEDVRVIGWIRDDVSAQEIAELQAEIEAWDTVDSVFFFSKQEAYEEAQRLLSNQPAALRVVQENPQLLPASLRVKPIQPDRYEEIVAALRARPGIEDVASAGPFIDGMVALQGVLRGAFWILAVVLGVAAVALIANTIHMAIFARREEIGVMKLVGAGNWFVRTPFLFEGMIEGLVGAGLAVGVVVLFYQMALDRLVDLPQFINLTIGNQFIYQRGILTLIVGVAAGFIGSGLAVHRFLRV